MDVMKLKGEEILPYVFGFIDTEIDMDGYVFFYRFTKGQRASLLENNRKIVSHTGSGIRLDVCGDFKNIQIKYRFWNVVETQYPAFDIYENGIYRQHVRKLEVKGPEDHTLTYNMQKPGRFTLYFPTYANLALLEVTADGAMKPFPQGSIKYLAHGDSISQGAFTENISESYVNTIARHFGWNLLNQSCSGYTFRRYPRDTFDFQPDVITIGYGSNDWSVDEKVDEDSKCFFSEIKTQYPNAQVFVITPIYRLRHNGICLKSDAEFSEAVNHLDLKFSDVRAIVEKNAKSFGFTVIDGFEMLEHNMAYFKEDFLHPNEAGHKLYGKNIVNELEKYFPAAD